MLRPNASGTTRIGKPSIGGPSARGDGVSMVAERLDRVVLIRQTQLDEDGAGLADLPNSNIPAG